MTTLQEFPYEGSVSERSLQNRIQDCIESISPGFESDNEDPVREPGLYTAIVSSRSVAGFAEPMGARHMSAYETALRPDVLTTITLSEESGHITTFQGGGYETVTREKIGEPWRDRNTQ